MHPVDIHMATEAEARPGFERNVTPDCGQRTLSFADLERWFSTSSPVDRVSYFRGFLALDRGPASRHGEEAGRELDRVATALMVMAETGDVHLIQRRNNPYDYTYIAIMSRAGVRRRASGGKRGLT